MLDIGIIEHVEESEWTSPIVIQEKKTTDEVRIYFNMRKLDMHDGMIHSQHHLQMKYGKVSEGKRCIHSLTTCLATIKS